MSQKSSYSFGTMCFCRLIGLVFLIAFLSFWVQMEGLIGEQGIVPTHQYLSQLSKLSPWDRFSKVPTLLWLDSSELSIHLVCALGCLSSLLLFMWITPRLMAFFCWGFYLSLFTSTQSFLSFQWDILLLECGFLTILASPWKARIPRASPLMYWLLWIVLFKLMFSSGVVKLTSMDPNWKNLSAMQYHYFTQPLPNPLSWFFHQFPSWLQELSTLFMFHIELLVPFLLFTTPRIRAIGAALLALLQILILVSGNYAYFNLLSIILCAPCITDHYWPQSWVFAKAPKPISCGTSTPARVLKGTLCSFFILYNFYLFMLLFAPMRSFIPRGLHEVHQAMRPFCLVNSYGLFATMTTKRPEILVQGSEDGRVWKDYGFTYKPGDLSRMPSQVAPHQPRLDWQMWFAALRPDYRYVPWFQKFALRLLEGSESVLALVETNPFPGKPPKWIRAVVYEYEFTSIRERSETGNWWKRKPLKIFLPPATLQ
jgi:lipase maturation factor 1